MTDSELFDVRIALLRAYLTDNQLDGVLLSRVDNFAMATGGKRNYVNLASDIGACSLLVRREGVPVLLANAIEAPRMADEEIAGFDCDVITFPWYEGSALATVERVFGGQFASDDGAIGANIHGELQALRALLTGAELEKYRAFGELAAAAMQSVLDTIAEGDTEAEIAARLVAAGTGSGFHVPVYLIAADERIANYRHPLPTSKPVRRYVMVVGGFQREGLNVSITRFKRVAALSPELEDAYARICCVDAVTQEATQPGATLSDVFGACQKAYADFGFDENEWHKHHQGGATGYGARTCKGSPRETFRVLDESWPNELRSRYGIDAKFGQAYAWNPSAPGVKSEDTFILWPDGKRETVTATPDLPRVDLESRLGRATEAVKSGMAAP